MARHAEDQGYWQVVESVGQGGFPGVTKMGLKDQDH